MPRESRLAGVPRPRARDLGIRIGTLPTGEANTITDVPGVRVGHATLIDGASVRTGVSVVLPHEGNPWEEPVFAGAHRLNGNGELTGLEWIRQCGMLTSPIGITNTHSVGVVHDALIAAEVERRGDGGDFWSLPVVGETWDGSLNDINGLHVRPEHARAALEAAVPGPVAEGNVGGGTGMICHEFKGGIGTSSRVVEEVDGCVVGVLVQANYGARSRFRVDGVPVGLDIPAEVVPTPEEPGAEPGGSIIILVGTNAPLLPGQCEALAQRAGLGLARVGGAGENSSGDLFLCFATGNRGLPSGDADAKGPLTFPLRMLSQNRITPLYYAVIEATEEAILNALCAAETMTGHRGTVVNELPLDLLVDAMARRGALAG
jgi:D-aminopeptidase